MLELRDGELYSVSQTKMIRKVTAPYVWYEGRTRLRLEVVWRLAFGEWPSGHVESIDGTALPASLRIVVVPEKFKGRIVK